MSHADWVVVASRQRSSSTSLARAIAQRLGPCSVFVDEMLHHHFPTYSLLGGWSSRPVHYRRSDPLGLARAAHAAWSNRVRNTTGACRDAHVTLVMKVFDVHKNVFLNKLFTHRRACTVILERDAASEECSLRWAAATGAMVIRASPWSKNVFDKLLAASKGPLMHIKKRRGALHYPDCAAQGGAWPCKLAMKWYRLPANRNSSARGFDCCWPEQGRVNNFFLERERGGGQANPMLNVRILPESILDARVGSLMVTTDPNGGEAVGILTERE